MKINQLFTETLSLKTTIQSIYPEKFNNLANRNPFVELVAIVKNCFSFEIFKILGRNFGSLYVSLLYYWHRTHNVGQDGNNEVCVRLGSTNKYINKNRRHILK
jgi:hypothetical protein